MPRSDGKVEMVGAKIQKLPVSEHQGKFLFLNSIQGIYP